MFWYLSYILELSETDIPAQNVAEIDAAKSAGPKEVILRIILHQAPKYLKCRGRRKNTFLIMWNKAKTHAEYLWYSFSNKSLYFEWIWWKNNFVPIVMSFISLFLLVESLPSYNKTHLSCGSVMNCPTLQNSEKIRTLKYMKHILIFQKHSYVLLNIECTQKYFWNVFN